MTRSLKLAVSLTLVGLTFAIAAPRVQAQTTLYQQASAFPTTNASWTSSFDSSGTGFNTMDDFVLSTGAQITSVTWQGFYWDFQTPANNPVAAPAAFAYQVAFLNSTGLNPNSYLYNQVATVNRTLVGTTAFNGDTVPVYNFVATLPAPFLAQAGVRYWVSPFAFHNSLNPVLSWMGSANTSGVSFQEEYINNVFQSRNQQPGDRVFAIIGTAAPEPGTLSLLALGALGGVLARRRGGTR